MVAQRIDPETMGRIEQAVRELAEMEYPRVWVGEAGTTPDEALADELFNLAESGLPRPSQPTGRSLYP